MNSRPIILEVFVRFLYPLMLLLSVWILLRGHNAPGGGFIGALVAVAASAIYAIAFHTRVASRKIPFGPVRLAATGVLLSLLSGLPAWGYGLPFLTHLWTEVMGIPLSTVIIFDLGVYLCVWGGLSALCLELIESALPTQRGAAP
jgi:multicomponent Na+:H+ antiporter subunit B